MLKLTKPRVLQIATSFLFVAFFSTLLAGGVSTQPVSAACDRANWDGFLEQISNNCTDDDPFIDNMKLNSYMAGTKSGDLKCSANASGDNKRKSTPFQQMWFHYIQGDPTSSFRYENNGVVYTSDPGKWDDINADQIVYSVAGDWSSGDTTASAICDYIIDSWYDSVVTEDGDVPSGDQVEKASIAQNAVDVCWGTWAPYGEMESEDTTKLKRAYYAILMGLSKKDFNDYVKAYPVDPSSTGNCTVIEQKLKLNDLLIKKFRNDLKKICKGNADGAKAINEASDEVIFSVWFKKSGLKCQDIISLLKNEADDLTGETSDTTCAVESVGWMICPVVTFLGKITDKMYDLLANNLLEVKAGEIFDTGGGAYQAWSTIRNLANVAFVLAFLFVIYSQITGAGLSNYGIKKMLPKIVIAAILVNISFWVCAVAVDVSNILGYSIKEFLDPSNGNFAFKITADGVTKTGNGWTGLAVAVVATAALVYVGLSVLLPALVVVALAVLTVVAVLAIRQALIILLIVVSPLAFVAYLLPNTEEWFKKWLSLLKTMLLVFPIIGTVFGASALASKVVMDAAQGNVFVSIVGALISIVPLFITPIIMKSAGGVLNRIGGVINNPNKGPFDRMRKGAEGYRKNRQEYRNLKSMNGYRSLPGRGTFSRMGSRRKAVLDNRKSELNRANASYVADLAENNSGFRKSLAQGGGDGSDMRALAGAINVQTKLSIDEVNAASAVIENLNLPSNQLNDLAKGHNVAGLEGSNEATRRAAIKSALKKATVADAEDIIKSSGTMTDAQRQDVVDGLVSNGITSKATHLGGKTLEDIAQGNVTNEADLDEAVAYHFNKGKYSAEALVSQDGASAERVHRVAAAGTTSKGTVIDSTQKATVKAEAAKVRTDSRLNTRISSDQARTALSGLETM